MKLFRAPFVLKHGEEERELLRADFVLIALLAGNDYDMVRSLIPRPASANMPLICVLMSSQTGIVGCGAATASRVALYGFGRTLCESPCTRPRRSSSVVTLPVG